MPAEGARVLIFGGPSPMDAVRRYNLYTGGGCRVAGNTASANGLDGIVAGWGTLVLGNTARANARFGLFLSGAAYGNNVLANNPGNPGQATQVIGGVPMGPNVCIGPTPCQ